MGAIRRYLRTERDRLARNRGGAFLLAVFCVLMSVGLWFGTEVLSVPLRIFLIVLGVATVIFCGMAYFDDDEGQ